MMSKPDCVLMISWASSVQLIVWNHNNGDSVQSVVHVLKLIVAVTEVKWTVQHDINCGVQSPIWLGEKYLSRLIQVRADFKMCYDGVYILKKLTVQIYIQKYAWWQSLLSCEHALSVIHHESCWVNWTQLYEASRNNKKMSKMLRQNWICLLLATPNLYTCSIQTCFTVSCCVWPEWSVPTWTRRHTAMVNKVIQLSTVLTLWSNRTDRECNKS